MCSILVKLLEPNNLDDVQSRAAILIADVASVTLQNRCTFAQLGCLEKLIRLLDSEVEDVLVNAINALGGTV